MLRSIRAPTITGPLLAAVLACPARSTAGPCASSAPTVDDPPVAGLFELVRRIDFDERPLGNFEATPMGWLRVSGAGMPAYSAGRLDDEFGHDGPPSFRVAVQGGHVGYEYQCDDLETGAAADCLIVVYVRAVGLKHARAFLHAYWVDAAGAPVPGSDRISRPVASLNPDGADEPWQRVETPLPGGCSTANALRLGLWVLQAQAWRPPAEPALDPIVRQDVRATVWFDDVTIYRLPRLGLRLSDPAGIVRPGETAQLVLALNNATARALTAEVTVLDVAGRERHRERHEVPEHTDGSVQMPLPPLEPGAYEAQLRLSHGSAAQRHGSVRFVVLPVLPPAGTPRPDLGVDLGCWRGGDVAGVVELLAELRCGAAKVGVPMIGAPDHAGAAAYLDQIRALVHELARARIDTAGVMLATAIAGSSWSAETTRHMLAAEASCGQRIDPVLTYLGSLLPTWQLGDEHVELAAPGQWDGDVLVRFRAGLARFVPGLELAVPTSLFDPGLGGDDPAAGPGATHALWDIGSVLVPADVPARSFPSQLAFLADVAATDATAAAGPATADMPRWWLTLETESTGLARDQRLADYARRVVLAKALGPERVYVPAPFELVTGSDGATWQPTEEYILLRTLCHYLAGKPATGATTLPDHAGVAIIFGEPGRACVVLWSWCERAPAEPVELYLGPHPVAIDLFGQRRKLELADGRAQVHLGPAPLILDEVDAPLALLQASFRVEPAYVQRHEPEPRPVLRLRNYYPESLAGKITFALPPGWRLSRPVVPFRLAAGETLSQPLHLELPPRELAAQQRLGVRVEVNAPTAAVLDFVVPITVGLRDVRVEVRTSWAGDDLIVEQSLQNLSAATLSFSAFCQAPGHARIDRAFLHMLPDTFQTRAYLFPNARHLAGATLRLGLEEIRGRRSLDQLVQIPD